MSTTSSRWFHRRGALSRDGWETVVDDTIDGWRWTRLRVAAEGSGPLRLEAGPLERMIVPLSGDVRIEHDGREQGEIELAGRANVFAGPADAAYLGSGVGATVTGGRFAVAEAPAIAELPVAVIRAADVPVEARGGGAASREVRNFGVPGGLPASRLLVCEVITPSGNWSGVPPHKHDEAVEGRETRLEEIYHFEVDVARGLADAAVGPDPIGVFAAYDSPGHEIDLVEVVRSGDVALVPYGYHGPAGAMPGYDLYYLNVMAGPDEGREWLITDDPSHAWVRGTWTSQRVEERAEPALQRVEEAPQAPSRNPAARGDRGFRDGRFAASSTRSGGRSAASSTRSGSGFAASSTRSDGAVGASSTRSDEKENR